MSSDKRNDVLAATLFEEKRRKAEEDRKRKGKGKLGEEVKAKEVPKGGRQTSLSIREPGSEATPPAPTTVPSAKPSVPSVKPSSAKSTKAVLRNVETPLKKVVASTPKKTTEVSAKKALQVDLTDTPKKSTTSVGETGKDVPAGMKPYKSSVPRKRKESDDVVPVSSKKPRVTKKPETAEEEIIEESEEEAGGLEIVITDDVAVERVVEHETTEVASEDRGEEEENVDREEEEEKKDEDEEEKEEVQTEAVYVPSTLIRRNVRRTVREVTSPSLPPSARHEPLERDEEVPEVGESAYVPQWNLRDGDSVFSSTSAALEFARKGLTPADRQRLESFSGVELGSLTISTACQVLVS